jgi:hypothetical protein
MYCVTPKGPLRIAVQRLTQLPHQIICPHQISDLEFFDQPKKIERVENGKNHVFLPL